MWYVMQVRTGTEEAICFQCGKKIPSKILERCFIPYYEEKKKLQGKWDIKRKILFPGYVFVITEELEMLYEALRGIHGLTKMIGTGREVVPLSVDEVDWLRRMGGDTQVVELSEGIIEGEQVIVTSGPLQGMEGYIKRIDRHKRKAYLEIPMFGRTQQIEVGLEIVTKTK